MKSPITRNELALKYIQITPLGEVRLTCGKNIFRLFKKRDTKTADLTATYLAQTLRNIILQESAALAESNDDLTNTLYQLKRCITDMIAADDCNTDSVQELYDTFFADYKKPVQKTVTFHEGTLDE